MYAFDFSPFFSENALGNPATYINAAGVSKDIEVVISMNPSDTSVGDVNIQNHIITVTALEDDVNDINTDCQIIVHELAIDEDRHPIRDDNGEQLCLEAIMILKVTAFNIDESGIVTIQCSRD